jgi:competence protein ComEC
MQGSRFYIILLCLFVAAFCLRLVFFIYAKSEETLIRHVGERAQVTGVVVNDPEHRATSLHINLRVSSVSGQEAKGTLLAILPPDIDLAYGDTVIVSGKITLPQSFATDTGRQFDYAGYLSVQGVSMMMQKAALEDRILGGWSLQKSLFNLKHIFESSIEQLFPQPDSSLLEGIELGERRALPEDLTHAFITSGLVHVVVLSGYNVSIVAESMLRVTSFLPKTLNYGVGGILMILFALMSGGGATTVRACLMGLIAILARYLNRPTDALRALVVAAAAMIMWNPLVALYDPSFILSVLATFGLITLSGTIERKLFFIPTMFGLRSIAASTLSVQIFVLPALLFITGVLSFVALPANMLALPVVPFAMLLGFLAGMAGLFHPILAYPFAIMDDLLLRWMMLVAMTADALPFSSVVAPAFPVWVAVAEYIPLTAFAIFVYIKSLVTRERRNVSQLHPS